VKTDRTLRIIIAALSSGSIASWAIWDNLAWLWSIIIATTQMLSIVNDYLPYKKRIKELFELKTKLIPIYDHMEHEWYNVSSGILSEKEINDMLSDIKAEWSKVRMQFFSSDNLPRNEKFLEIADVTKLEYFKTSF
jgi:hypothetical protein